MMMPCGLPCHMALSVAASCNSSYNNNVLLMANQYRMLQSSFVFFLGTQVLKEQQMGRCVAGIISISLNPNAILFGPLITVNTLGPG